VFSNTTEQYGGGIFYNGRLTLENSVVLSNTASGGGGLTGWIRSIMTLSPSTLQGNQAFSGAGLYSTGQVVLQDSTLRGNAVQRSSPLTSALLRPAARWSPWFLPPPRVAPLRAAITSPSTVLLTCNPGQTLVSIGVPVVGDTQDEADENYYVILSSPVNTDELDGQGEGTIVDDDGLSALSIGDVTLNERDSGITQAHFVVSLSPAASLPA
jgi:hypothetical protein